MYLINKADNFITLINCASYLHNILFSCMRVIIIAYCLISYNIKAKTILQVSIIIRLQLIKLITLLSKIIQHIDKKQSELMFIGY